MIKDSDVQQLTPEDFSRTTVSFKKKAGVAGEKGERTWQILKRKGRCNYFFCTFVCF